MSLVNKKFGRLTVLREVRKGKTLRKIYWDCLCDCGKETNVYGVYLVNGDTKSCGCLKTEKKPGLKKPKSREHYQRGSAKKAYSTSYTNEGDTISFEDFYRLAQMDCYYCGQKPINAINAYNDKRYLPEAKENGKFIYNGLDRVDNSLPHTLENCVTCCKHCNYAKRDMSQQKFLEYRQQRFNHFQKSKEFFEGEIKLKEILNR
jgi:hypothetical protein